MFTVGQKVVVTSGNQRSLDEVEDCPLSPDPSWVCLKRTGHVSAERVQSAAEGVQIGDRVEGNGYYSGFPLDSGVVTSIKEGCVVVDYRADGRCARDEHLVITQVSNSKNPEPVPVAKVDDPPLIGRKPEKVVSPVYPGPFTSDQRTIKDADGYVLLTGSAYNQRGTDLLAKIRDLLNSELDAPVLREFVDNDGDRWFEVAPGKALCDNTRQAAEDRFARYPRDSRSVGSAYTPWTVVGTGQRINGPEDAR